MKGIDRKTYNKNLDKLFRSVGFIFTSIGLFVLVFLFANVFFEGKDRLTIDFIKAFPSRNPSLAGIFPALVGSIWLIVLTAIISIPIGIGAGIYMEEYAKKNWLTNFLEINIANLASVPSIIYGLLGLGLFVRGFGLGRSILSGALTLSILILPIIIISTREALKSVPYSIREGSYALGATKWQTIRYQVLPAALGNIMTGIILALSRAVGETAPLITIGAITYISFIPQHPISLVDSFPYIKLSLNGVFEQFTTLPIQIFNWISRPQKGFHINAAAAIIILLVFTFLMNLLAILLRYKHQKKIRW